METSSERFGARVARTFEEGPGRNVRRRTEATTGGPGGGKHPLNELRGFYPFQVGPSDPRKPGHEASGAVVVDVHFKGRLDVKNAFGANVARTVSGLEGVDRHVPGKVIGQRVVGEKLEYTAVFANSTRETLDEVKLRHYSQIYSTASTRPLNPIGPIVVRLS